MHENLRIPIAILSAEKSNLNITKNNICSERLKLDLNIHLTHAWKAASVQGCYLGVKEKSFKINVEDKKDYNLILKLLKKYDQEYALFIDCNRHAWELYSNGDKVFLGIFVIATKSEVLSLDSYTYDFESQQYYKIIALDNYSETGEERWKQ